MWLLMFKQSQQAGVTVAMAQILAIAAHDHTALTANIAICRKYPEKILKKFHSPTIFLRATCRYGAEWSNIGRVLYSVIESGCLSLIGFKYGGNL